MEGFVGSVTTGVPLRFEIIVGNNQLGPNDLALSLKFQNEEGPPL